jgi:hypothetical protein
MSLLYLNPTEGFDKFPIKVSNKKRLKQKPHLKKYGKTKAKKQKPLNPLLEIVVSAFIIHL